MSTSTRVEAAARALARYRLGRHTFSPSLNSRLLAKLCQKAEDKLWPSLVEEAQVVVEAVEKEL